MRVHVKYFSALREITNNREEELDVKDSCTVIDLLEFIASKYGETSAISSNLELRPRANTFSFW